MTDQELALQAVSEAQQILEEYLQPRPQNNERRILDQLVEVLERPDLVIAVDRLQQRSQTRKRGRRQTLTPSKRDGALGRLLRHALNLKKGCRYRMRARPR